jgi:hypothetical protein
LTAFKDMLSALPLACVVFFKTLGQYYDHYFGVFFLKTNAMIQFWQKSAVFRDKKRQRFG